MAILPLHIPRLCLSSVSRNVHQHQWSLSRVWLKFLSGDGDYVGDNEVRHPQHIANESISSLRGRAYPEPLIFAPLMVNGEVVRPLSPDINSLKRDFRSNVLPQRRARARPRAHHASVPCLAWASDDPTSGLLGWPRTAGITCHPLQLYNIICFCGSRSVSHVTQS